MSSASTTNDVVDEKTTTTTTTNATTHSPKRRLQGAICVVTGASRGIGKGVALELGKQGATVYVTGTSSSLPSESLSNIDKKNNNNDNNNNNNNYNNNHQEPGTVEETANAITKLGGIGIPVICDHADDGQVRALFQQIRQEHGRIDILVNNAFRIPPGGASRLMQKFWHDTDAQMWDTQQAVGLRSHYVASCFAVPIMIEQQRNQQRPSTTVSSVPPRPLIVMIGSFGGISYSFNVAYGVIKAGVDRLAKDMAFELKEENISVVSLWPGVVMTERNQRSIDSGEWQEHVKLPLDHLESPSLTGKVIVELALDATNLQKTGTFQVVAELARDYYQIQDQDDDDDDDDDVNSNNNNNQIRQIPPSIRSLKFILPAYAFDDKLRQLIPTWLIPDWKLPFWVMAQGRPSPSSKS